MSQPKKEFIKSKLSAAGQGATEWGKKTYSMHRDKTGIPFFKKLFSASMSGHPIHPQYSAVRKQDCDLVPVFARVTSFGPYSVSEEERMLIRSTSFNNWDHTDDQLILYLRQMFYDLDFMNKFKFDLMTLELFLFEVYRNYNNVPYHNFNHCFMATQMANAFIWINELWRYFTDLELFSLLVSVMCHDLNHPGLTTHYHQRVGTVIGLRYQSDSPLENHHLATAKRILAKDECNILRCLSLGETKQFMRHMKSIIMATDMRQHFPILNKFNSIADRCNLNDPYHRDLLMQMIMKASDISNEARPVWVTEQWAENLYVEYFAQGRLEKSLGIVPDPFCDEAKVEKASSQCYFIQNFCIPLAKMVSRVLPNMDKALVINLETNLLKYSRMKPEHDKQEDI